MPGGASRCLKHKRCAIHSDLRLAHQSAEQTREGGAEIPSFSQALRGRQNQVFWCERGGILSPSGRWLGRFFVVKNRRGPKPRPRRVGTRVPGYAAEPINSLTSAVCRHSPSHSSVRGKSGTGLETDPRDTLAPLCRGTARADRGPAGGARPRRRARGRWRGRAGWSRRSRGRTRRARRRSAGASGGRPA